MHRNRFEFTLQLNDLNDKDKSRRAYYASWAWAIEHFDWRKRDLVLPEHPGWIYRGVLIYSYHRDPEGFGGSYHGDPEGFGGRLHLINLHYDAACPAS